MVWRKIVSSIEGTRQGRACEASGGKTPLVRGFRGSSQGIIFNFEHLCRVCLMLSLSNWWFWTRFQSFSQVFARKGIPWRARNLILDKIFFRRSQLCMFLLHYFTYMSRQVLLLALTTSWWYFEDSFFEGSTYVFSLEYPLKMYKLFRFWRPNLLVDRPTCTHDIVMKPEPTVEPWRLKTSLLMLLYAKWMLREPNIFGLILEQATHVNWLWRIDMVCLTA